MTDDERRLLEHALRAHQRDYLQAALRDYDVQLQSRRQTQRSCGGVLVAHPRWRSCERAAKHGIDERRLELLGYSDHRGVMQSYAECDIALDPFPFSGCATSFDALWMGLPVVTKIGDTMVGPQTASILRERVCEAPRHARELGDALREAWRLSCRADLSPTARDA